jgi:hypothetical protein
MPDFLSSMLSVALSLDPEKMERAYAAIPPHNALVACPRIGGAIPQPGWEVESCCLCNRPVWSSPDAEAVARRVCEGVSCVCVDCVTRED